MWNRFLAKLNKTKSPKDRTLLVFIAIGMSTIAINNLVSNKKQAIMQGFAFSFLTTLQAARQLKLVTSIDVDPETPLKLPDLYMTYLTRDIVDSCMNIYRIIVQKAYSKKTLLAVANDPVPLSLYFMGGMTLGLVAAFIYLYKSKYITKDDFKKLIKQIPQSLNHTFAWKYVKKDAISGYIRLAIQFMFIVSLLFGIKALIQILRGNRGFVEKAFKFNKQNKLFEITWTVFYLGLYKGFDSKSIIKTITGQLTKKAIDDSRKTDPPLPKYAKEVYLKWKEAIKILKEHVRKAGYRLNNIKFKFEVDSEFNAFANPLDTSITFLCDKKYAPKLEANEIAAILAHELGHLYEMKKELKNIVAVFGIQMFSMIITLINLRKLLSFYSQNIIKNMESELILSIIDAIHSSYMRLHEISADAFAGKIGLGMHLYSALEKLGLGSLTDINFAQDEHDIPRRRLQAIREAFVNIGKLKDMSEFVITI